METPTPLLVEETTPSFPAFPVYALWAFLLVAWQGWMTLGLFGPGPPWERLGNDQPILSGKHPLNLYLGTLGAQALRTNGSSCCYDPAYLAGYPKTPIFNGSRLAELFLLAGGGSYQPAAYKIGLCLVCLLVPGLLILAGRAFGLGWGTTLLGTTASLLLWWGQPEHNALKNGEIELWLGALALLAHTGLLVKFHQAAGFFCWLALVLTAALAWFCQPFLIPVYVPLILVYYLSVGTKHRWLLWHLALLGSLIAPLAVNAFWLLDWIDFWWVRTPASGLAALLPHRTLQTFWEAPLWGEAADRMLAVLVLGSAAVGIWLLNHRPQRPVARLLGLGTGLLLALALLGISWEPLGQMGTAGLLVPALWFAALPAAHAWTQALAFSRSRLGSRFGLAGFFLLLGGLGILGYQNLFSLVARCTRTEPLLIGLGPQQEALVEKLILHTGPGARILWEDQSGEQSHWTALLAMLTGRSFVGALDPQGTIEHGSIRLHDRTLNGRPITSWSDVALEEYCRLYNVGWVVCWSPATAERIGKWPAAQRLTALCPRSQESGARIQESGFRNSKLITQNSKLRAHQGQGWLFALQPHVPSFSLKGQAQLVHADCHHITLADVVPENGVVVLSLHYQAGLRALPSRVQVERERDAQDPIGFIRLRVAGPVARVTLTWDDW